MQSTTTSLTAKCETLRPKLLAFTLLQVSDKGHAEDLVQEAMLTAIESLSSYAGKAQFDTWVYSILRHKLIDHIRKETRGRQLFISDDNTSGFDGLFDTKGHWNAEAVPTHWQNPEDLHMRSHFWEIFDLCLLHLPSNTARVFALRELMELETDEICDCLGISEQNCWTILHRARLKLRGCLEKGWFLKEGNI